MLSPQVSNPTANPTASTRKPHAATPYYVRGSHTRAVSGMDTRATHRQVRGETQPRRVPAPRRPRADRDVAGRTQTVVSGVQGDGLRAWFTRWTGRTSKR